VKFIESEILGCYEILPQIISDERGSFVKTFHKDTFVEKGLEYDFVEEYYSISKKGVLRGMHFQLPPYQHTKMVYCIGGNVMDVVVDLRKKSESYGKYSVFDLSAEKNNIIYIPVGCAHGFYTLSESATMIYKVNSMYNADHDSGIRWNSIGIQWPSSKPLVSIRDQNLQIWKDFNNPFVLEAH